jgi:hypothetical protein
MLKQETWKLTLPLAPAFAKAANTTPKLTVKIDKR